MPPPTYSSQIGNKRPSVCMPLIDTSNHPDLQIENLKRCNEVHMVVTEEAAGMIGTSAKLEEGDTMTYL